MRVLLTGAAGFIGSHVVDLLVERGHDVVAVDSLAPQVHARKPEYLAPGADFHRVDLTCREELEPLLSGIDAVSHQASVVGLETSMQDAPLYVRNNALGTAELLAGLTACGFRGRFVLASSMVVYGEGAYRCAKHGNVTPGPRNPSDLAAGSFEPLCPRCGAPVDAEAVDETASLDPRSVYAATKVHQEHLCDVYARATGNGLVMLRYHNVYGPRMPRDTPYAGVASIFRSALQAGEAPQVFEDGKQKRDFIHVRDVARANVLALEATDVTGPFNVATGRPATVREMADALCDAYGPTAPRPVVTGTARPGDVRHVFASPARAGAELGFHAEVDLAAGMAAFATDELRLPAPAG